MKNFLFALGIMLALCTQADAQSFIWHLKKKVPGQGVVTVNQVEKLSELIDNRQPSAVDKKKKSEAVPGTPDTPSRKPDDAITKQEQTAEKNRTLAQDVKKEEKDNAKPAPGQKNAQEKKTTAEQTAKPATPKKQETAAATPAKDANDGDRQKTSTAIADEKKDATDNADLKPTLKQGRGYKVDGYRIQVYAGGNSRKDRIEAERTNNSIKEKFPDQPVYTHFYNPRWICRMGNYRSYQEASEMLKLVQEAGFKQACIVKGKITVQY